MMEDLEQEEEGGSISCLGSLLSELQLHILSFLEASDIYNVALINRHFHSLSDDPLLWKSLYRRLFSGESESLEQALIHERAAKGHKTKQVQHTLDDLRRLQRQQFQEEEEEEPDAYDFLDTIENLEELQREIYTWLPWKDRLIHRCELERSKGFFEETEVRTIKGLQVSWLEDEVSDPWENFFTYKANGGVCSASRGKWYYEAEIEQCGVLQLGWVTQGFDCLPDTGNGVGDDRYSWSFDGFRREKFHNDTVGDEWGDEWHNGDRVGVALDLDAREISYFINGEPQGVAFTRVRLHFGSCFYPAFSMGGHLRALTIDMGIRTRVKLFFEPNEMKHLPAGFLPLHSAVPSCFVWQIARVLPKTRLDPEKKERKRRKRAQLLGV